MLSVHFLFKLVEASKLVEDHEKPNETFTDGQEQEEEVCLILGDPDDAEDDDIPHVTISKPNQDTSMQQKSENKDSIGDVTPVRPITVADSLKTNSLKMFYYVLTPELVL